VTGHFSDADYGLIRPGATGSGIGITETHSNTSHLQVRLVQGDDTVAAKREFDLPSGDLKAMSKRIVQELLQILRK
jgi:hypothetical protein